MFYIHGPFPTALSKKWPYDQASHLLIGRDDDLEELHRFAARLGLRRDWFQDRPDFPHYDLTLSKHKLAVKHGACVVDVRGLIEKCKRDSFQE